MKNVIYGLVMIVIGLATIVFNRGYARKVTEFQNESFGFHFGEKVTKYNAWLALLVGIVLVVLGVFVIFGIVALKS